MLIMEASLHWLVLPAAFMLDVILGDPHRLPHPVRWMGRAISACEPSFRRITNRSTLGGGLYAGFLICSTWLLTHSAIVISQRIHPLLCHGLEIILLFYCLSARSLASAAKEIYHCLADAKVDLARYKVSMIVGRDVSGYDAGAIARATVETVAENLVDGVTAPLFYAAIGGVPLAMTYKMMNTLDSMVGYQNDAYRQFGKVSARIDDIVNYVPARLTVPIIALAGHILAGRGIRSLRTAVAEGANHTSPNAGFAEAAFAGVLGVKLNGPNTYHGRLVEKPYIGIHFGHATAGHIVKACDLMLMSSVLWLVLMVAGGVMIRLVP
jgi:adenosylcobinamide-phosphate synthase